MTQVYERPQDRNFERSQSPGEDRYEFLYVVDGASSMLEAYAAVAGHLSANGMATYGGLPLGKMTGTEIAKNVYEVRVPYEPKDTPDKPDGDGVILRFNTTGATEHIEKSYGTARYDGSGLAPDFSNAIGVRKGGIDGVDVLAPHLDFELDGKQDADLVTVEYVKTLSRVTATTNVADWGGFAAGELLFVGARGQREGEEYTITYAFLASENVNQLVIDGIGEPVNKKGHQYIWFLWEDVEDEDAAWLAVAPRGCYVETVYRESNFDQLGIGNWS